MQRDFGMLNNNHVVGAYRGHQLLSLIFVLKLLDLQGRWNTDRQRGSLCQCSVGSQLCIYLPVRIFREAHT